MSYEKVEIVDIEENLKKAAKAIKEAQYLIFTSGAGLGVDSGLPDFRGPEGFWKAYPPLRELNISFSGMSNPIWFTKDPEFAWGFWSHRYHLYNNTPPHGGFDIMKNWGEKLVNGRYFVFTSNVDGAFGKKDFDKDKLLECHGSVHYMQCNSCETIFPSTDTVVPQHDNKFRSVGFLPHCSCGTLIRPNVLMFSDGEWNGARYMTQNNNYTRFKKSVGAHKVAIIEIGAGTYVPTVRQEGEELVEDFDQGTLIRINPGEYELKKSIKEKMIPLNLGGLDALRRINEYLEKEK